MDAVNQGATKSLHFSPDPQAFVQLVAKLKVAGYCERLTALAMVSCSLTILVCVAYNVLAYSRHLNWMALHSGAVSNLTSLTRSERPNIRSDIPHVCEAL